MVACSPWNTPLSTLEFKIAALCYDTSDDPYTVTAELVPWNTRKVYTLRAVCHAFRLIDESGLLQIWQARAFAGLDQTNTFRVRGHGWSKESHLVFENETKGGWSHIVATQDECLELVCKAEPEIEERSGA